MMRTSYGFILRAAAPCCSASLYCLFATSAQQSTAYESRLFGLFLSSSSHTFIASVYFPDEYNLSASGFSVWAKRAAVPHRNDAATKAAMVRRYFFIAGLPAYL